jgi:hypothetical protein
MDNEVKEEVQENIITPSDDGIQICTWCFSWWRNNEIEKHNSGCKVPYQGP